MEDFKTLLAQIERNKEFYGKDYQNYGLLFCRPDGRPYDPKDLSKLFTNALKQLGIPDEERISFQGLRKSGQMHKFKVTNHNSDLVSSTGSHADEVRSDRYNEQYDEDYIEMARLVEEDFYPRASSTEVLTASTEGQNAEARHLNLRATGDNAVSSNNQAKETLLKLVGSLIDQVGDDPSAMQVLLAQMTSVAQNAT